MRERERASEREREREKCERDRGQLYVTGFIFIQGGDISRTEGERLHRSRTGLGGKWRVYDSIHTVYISASMQRGSTGHEIIMFHVIIFHENNMTDTAI